MGWLKDKLTEAQSVLQLAFVVITIAMATWAMVQRKLISIILLFLSAGILGWLVWNTQNAADKAGSIFK